VLAEEGDAWVGRDVLEDVLALGFELVEGGLVVGGGGVDVGVVVGDGGDEGEVGVKVEEVFVEFVGLVDEKLGAVLVVGGWGEG